MRKAKLIFSLFNKLKNTKLTMDDIKKANNKSDMLGALADEFKLLLRMFNAYRLGKFKISKTDLSLIIGVIAYVVLPIDIIPDFLGLFGFFDDIYLLTYVLKKIRSLLDEFRKFENEGAIEIE